jgi:transposase-like protein
LSEEVLEEGDKPVNLSSTFDDSTLEAPVRERFLRNLRAVEAVLAGATVVEAAREHQIARSTLSRLVQRTRTLGVLACVPHGTYSRERDLHPAFQEVIRRLYLLPTKLSITAITEHADLKRAAKRLQEDTGTPIPLPSYCQVRDYVHVLKQQPEARRLREQMPGPLRDRQSPRSFALSIPAPAQLAQVDEHSLELYVVTPDGIPLTRQVHAAVLICVKTAAIMSAVLTLGPLKEEDDMRLVKGMLEPKDRLVLQAGCQHPWPCFGKPAVIFQDRGKIFPSERARQVLVDRLGIITEQAPPYCPSAKGTVEALFRWMTQRFERRLPNTSHGIHDAEEAARAGAMTLEELERYFYRAIVDDYQQSWDGLRRQIRAVLWEEAVRQTGVPQYLGAPDDLKLLLMKAQNRKAGSHAYRVPDRSRLAFQGHWYVCPGLLSRLSNREFEIYYDRRDISVIYLFVEGSYVGEAYCQAFMGQRVSEWEAAAMRKHDRERAKAAASATQQVRTGLQEEMEATKKQRGRATRMREQARQFDRHREEIHPSPVLSELEALRPPPPASLRLPEAKPDPEKEYPVQHLAIRYRDKEPSP